MVFNKAKYNREHQAKLYADYKVRRAIMLDSLGGVCKICTFSNTELHFHHLEYHPTESDYKRNSKSMSVRLKRLKEAENHPERFCLLCPRCHGAIEALKYFLNTTNALLDDLIFYIGK